jgi:hypothetical protein
LSRGAVAVLVPIRRPTSPTFLVSQRETLDVQLLPRERSHRFGNDRQHYERSVLRIMMDSLVGWLHYCIDTEWMASIRVAVIVWKVAARYLQPDLVAWEKQVASRPNVDDVLVSLAGADR